MPSSDPVRTRPTVPIDCHGRDPVLVPRKHLDRFGGLDIPEDRGRLSSDPLRTCFPVHAERDGVNLIGVAQWHHQFRGFRPRRRTSSP